MAAGLTWRIQYVCADIDVCTRSNEEVRSRELQVLEQHVEFTEVDEKTQLTSAVCIKCVIHNI